MSSSTESSGQTAEPVFMVFLDVDPEHEVRWNDWYNRVHVPEVMSSSPAIVSATRYHLRDGNVPYRYLAVYRFTDADSLAQFMASDELAVMGARYDEQWGSVTTRMRAAYVPLMHVCASPL